MRTRKHPSRDLYETRISVEGKRISFYGSSPEAVQKAGLEPKPFHSLRKSCATELERVGCPQGLISAILGHSGGGVTRLYIHNSEEMMRQFLNRVCEAVAGHAEEEKKA